MTKKKTKYEVEVTSKGLNELDKKTRKAAGGFNALTTSQRGADRAGKGLTRQ